MTKLLIVSFLLIYFRVRYFAIKLNLRDVYSPLLKNIIPVFPNTLSSLPVNIYF